MAKGGDFEIEVSASGYPVWCEIRYRGEWLTNISHKELSDLQYAVTKAMQEARAALVKPGEGRERYRDADEV